MINSKPVSPKNLINKEDYNNIEEYKRLYSSLYSKLNRDIKNDYYRNKNIIIVCDCGKKISKDAIKHHKQGKIHKKYLEFKNNEEYQNLLSQKKEYYDKYKETGDKKYKLKYQSIVRKMRKFQS